MPAIAQSIITVDEAKAFLNITNTASDTELTDFVAAASQLWVNRVGPVAGPTTYDEWYDGGRPMIVLRHTPVQSVTSVTESYGTSIHYTLTEQVLDSAQPADSYGYSVDLDAGIITRRAMGVPIGFAAGVLNVHVVYTAGYGTVPADIKQAVKLLVKHMWQTQRGASVRPGTGGEDFNPATTFTWPRRVQEIAEAYMIPGIA